MAQCFFASDLHGVVGRYSALFQAVRKERPRAVFLGGDLTSILPPEGMVDFLDEYVGDQLSRLRAEMGEHFPPIYVILGNDDSVADEESALRLEAAGLWHYLHLKTAHIDGCPILGCGFVPPTPFAHKDWERYDVSRYIPPGSISPEEGRRARPIQGHVIRKRTIALELEELAGERCLERGILLAHSPPADTLLDRAARDGMMIDQCPLDLHVGSIALRRFIESRRPRISLHGHIHESARITGSWKDRIGPTHLFTAAHDGPELALITFDLDRPETAVRRLLPAPA